MSSVVPSNEIRIERAGSEHADALAALFERADCPCYCRYWDFPGDHRQWQDRCANDRAVSRQELLEALNAAASDPHGLFGLVALDAAGTCVGWMRIERPARLHKQYEGRLYRGLPCFNDRPPEAVLAIACFLVDEDWRHSGVATKLLAHGIQLAQSAGARFIEAFPRRAENIRDEEHWLGPPSLYEKAGFVVVHDFAPYPVLRLDLGE